MEIVVLNPIAPYDLEVDYSKVDNIHFSTKEIDGYNKDFNLVYSVREDGKTASFDLKSFSKLRRFQATPIMILRQVNEVSEEYVDSLKRRWNKWLRKPIDFYYSKKDLDNGLATLYFDKKKQSPAVKVVSLAKNVDITKKFFIARPGDLFIDEVVLNTRTGSKYLKGEVMKVKEIYKTFYREFANAKIPRPKFYGFGNPYSWYNPYNAELGVDCEKIKEQGNVQVIDKWAIMHHRMNPLLLEEIKRKDPLYSIEGEYAKYAYGGVAINDSNVRLVPKCPNEFNLVCIFYANGKNFGIWQSYNYDSNLLYWIGTLKSVGKRREIFSFNFGDLIEGSALINSMDRLRFQSLKIAIGRREVGFETLEANYIMEEVYKLL